jgi:hypothetical protein
MYSKYRPDLAALGAQDGLMLSGLAIDDNDPLARRDQGLEFLDVTKQLGAQMRSAIRGDDQVDIWKFTNSSSSVVDTHLLVIVKALPNGVRMENASGMTRDGDPYLRVFLPDGVLNPGQSLQRKLIFERKPHAPAITYSLTFLSGQGTP